jgi:hypothetical protein
LFAAGRAARRRGPSDRVPRSQTRLRLGRTAARHRTRTPRRVRRRRDRLRPGPRTPPATTFASLPSSTAAPC